MTAPSRREFLRQLSMAGTVVAGASFLLPSCSNAGESTSPGNGTAPPTGQDGRFLLRRAPELAPNGITVTGAPGTADVGGGLMAPVWALNASVPSPLLRMRKGDRFRVTMRNQLPQELILHWHGMAPPVEMDGHPRFAVPTGGTYEYDFAVTDRAGTYWYHSHTHMHTGEHTYRGIGGLIVVSDDEEERLRLPTGARELPLIIQDRRVDASGVPLYNNAGPAMMAGVMGDEPFVNGVRRPYVEVDSAVYRLRILNGANARIFRLARSDNGPFTLIGNDGGLLEQAVSLTSLDMAPAERADLLLDLRNANVGDRIMLRSLPFSIPGSMGFMGGANLQGNAMDLLELRVTRRVNDATTIPTALSSLNLPNPAAAVRERTFRFQSMMMSHTINGREFDMQRVDETVPFGDTEIWSFVNDSSFPHPVHLHATHFRVLSRTGGRGQLFPWEAGRKDTVLMYPGETIRVAVRFTAQRGLFLMHCHNLEHEDMGMMINVLVE
jgi:FtsP/CotA-like multicopper oxidase with cupredoxin domain